MSKAARLSEFIIQDIISYIVEDDSIEYDDAMRRFYASQTFDMLMDPETGLYIEGSEYIYGIYRDEEKYGSLKDVML